VGGPWAAFSPFFLPFEREILPVFPVPFWLPLLWAAVCPAQGARGTAAQAGRAA